MLQAGKNIVAVADQLTKINVDYLYNAIKNPKTDILHKIKQLRIVRSIDTKQYAQLKKQLPYFVCGIFNPPIRKRENFGYTSYFVLDIDHISEKGLDVDMIKSSVCKDERVLMAFLSPGEDGLKVIFRFKERCYDIGLYSAFYKIFATDFSLQYNLNQVIDLKTSDVTRACFVSFDEKIYYNPDAMPVDLNLYVNENSPNLVFQELKQIEKVEGHTTETNISKQPPCLEQDVLDKIKSVLNHSKPKEQFKNIYVPEQLNDIMGDLSTYITNIGVVITDVSNINYGKKIKAVIGTKKAEINLFYGKRGYSVVKSPRTGTSDEMNQILVDLIEAFLAESM